MNHTNICVPKAALRNHLTFKDWYNRISYNLFQFGQKPHRFDVEMNSEEKLEFIENIMKYVNLVYHGSFHLIDYKTKNKKWSCAKTDVAAITCIIILDNFNITYTELGKYFGLHHSTVVYYVKRHSNYCMSSDYRNKYFKLINTLQHEGIIPTTEGQRYKSQQLVSSTMSGIKSKH